jgi:predicted ArsR family transcriptional regulator
MRFRHTGVVEIVGAREDRGTAEAATPATDPATAADGVVLATRQRVLRAVVQDGPVTVADLSAGIGLTPAAVRRHLDALVADGLVVGRDLVRTGGRGRPARSFTATDAGRSAAVGALRGAAVEGDDLATSALRHLAAATGRAAVVAVARDRARALAARYAPAVDGAGPDLRARVGALAVALSADGYAASSRAVLPAMAAAQRGHPGDRGARAGAVMAPSAVQLCQGSCPVQHVAQEFPELCEAETEAFADLLGTHVRRLATLAHGEHVCTTHVPLFAPRTATASRTTASRTTEPSGGTPTP